MTLSRFLQQICKQNQYKLYQISMSIEEEDTKPVHPRDSEQIQELYGLEQFILLVQGLSQQSINFYCPHSQKQLSTFYYKKCNEIGLSQMNLQNVRKFIQALRNQNRRIIQTEVKYFQEQISKKKADNLQIMTKKEFKKVLDIAVIKFSKDGLDYQIVTNILLQKSVKSEFFSCEKIADMLKEIANQITQFAQPSLSTEDILARRISTKPQTAQPQSTHEQLSDPVARMEKYLKFLHIKVKIFTEYITDLQIRQQAEALSQSLQRKEKDLLQDMSYIYIQNQEAQDRCQQYRQNILRLQQQKQLYIDIVSEQKNIIYELKTKIVDIENQKKEAESKNLQMETQFQLGTAQLVKMQQFHQEELRDQREKYVQLLQEYEKVAKENNFQSKIVKKQQIFQKMSQKQQLDDILHKFNRQKKQRQMQKAVAFKNQEEKNNIIELQQIKIRDLQSELRKKNENLIEFVASSGILYDNRNSILNRSSIGNQSYMADKNDSFIVLPRGSALMNSTIKKNKIKPEFPNIQLHQPSRIHARLGQELLSKFANKNKIEKINIAHQDLSQIQEENSTRINISPERQQENTDSNMQQHYKKINQKKPQIQFQAIETDNFQEQNFMAKGVFINVHGVRSQVNILLTHDKFCYFDEKSKLTRYLTLKNIKSFVFCRQNCNLLIMIPKYSQQLDKKKQIINPMIFSLRRRDRFAQYLTTKMSKLMQEHKIQIITKFQDDIQLKTDTHKKKMKPQIAMNTPQRLALSDQRVFYVKLQDEGLLSFKCHAIIVIQPMGLLCFKGDQINQLDIKQELLYFLPLVNSQLSQIQDSRQAPGKQVRLSYQNKKQVLCNFVFNSKEDLKLFIKACQQQKAMAKANRTAIYQHLNEEFKRMIKL